MEIKTQIETDDEVYIEHKKHLVTKIEITIKREKTPYDVMAVVSFKYYLDFMDKSYDSKDFMTKDEYKNYLLNIANEI